MKTNAYRSAPLHSKSAASGFTLLEVILAVLIFSMIIGAVYATFRSAIQMYKVGGLQRTVYQEARMLHSMTMKDMRSTLGIEETFYDIPPFPLDTTGTVDYSHDTSWVPDETTYSVALYPFLGSATSISCYSYGEVPLGFLKGMRQGIFKINYDYVAPVLSRKVDDISGDFKESEDLVHHLMSCELSYGYKKEGKMYWTDHWDSRRDDNRTPKDEKESDDFFNPERKTGIRVYPDNLPDAVRIVVKIQRPDNPKGEGQEFEWLCDVPSAKPSFIKEKKQD